jgi:hypothetical protein
MKWKIGEGIWDKQSPWTHDDYVDVSENDKLTCKYLFP